MMASWMLYAALVSGLLTVAAVAVERVASARRWPARFVWAAALCASVAWPVADALRRLAPRPVAPVTMLPFTITLRPTQAMVAAGPDLAAAIDRGLLVLWCVGSALLLLRLTRDVIVLQRTRRGWRSDEIDGTSVRLSSNMGPAVVGLRAMEVVLPDWILTLDAPLRAIVLRHEEEHRQARDPYLLFAGALALVLMPWNLALWMQVRRLRLAIEMDCDARVLRVHPSPERYGLLMLTVAQRRSIAPPVFAPMLSEPVTQLERRILAMRTMTRQLARVTVYGGTAVALTVLAFACSLQSDNPVAPVPVASRAQPTRVTDNQTFFEFQVEKTAQAMPGNPAPRYPDMLRSANVEGDVLVQFVLDTTGVPNMGTLKVLKSTHDLFTASVRGALPTLRFTPAEVGGRKVKQLIQMPFTFSLTKGAEVTSSVVIPSPTRRGVIGSSPKRDEASLREVPVAAGAQAPSATRRAPRSEEAATKGLPSGPGTTYFEFQVEKRVSPYPENPSPRYPDMLRSANVEGDVLGQFIVDENGFADPSTFKALKSTHDLFTNAVRQSLANMRFYPAQVGGKPVRQLVQMPFQFSLAKP